MTDPSSGRRIQIETLPAVDRVKMRSQRRKAHGSFILLTFCACFATWIILSGKFDLFHLALGVISSLTVAVYSGDMLMFFKPERGVIGKWFRFILYIPWLLYEVFRANLHVMRLVFHPRMMDGIDPHIIRFRSRLRSDLAILTFANSITLTPGTITVYVSVYGDFTVHCIDKESAHSLPGEMENHIAKIFGE